MEGLRPAGTVNIHQISTNLRHVCLVLGGDLLLENLQCVSIHYAHFYSESHALNGYYKEPSLSYK